MQLADRIEVQLLPLVLIESGVCCNRNAEWAKKMDVDGDGFVSGNDMVTVLERT
jgi:hypothetical protein